MKSAPRNNTLVDRRPRAFRSKKYETLALLLMMLLNFALFAGLVGLVQGASAQSASKGQDTGAAALPACGPNWVTVDSPNLGTAENSLHAVDALASNDVWAVGSFTNGYFDQTLIEHWNGTSWSVVPSPNADTNRNELLSVSALSTNDVWVAGDYSRPNTKYADPLIEHWNGSSWSISPSLPRGIDSGFSAVTAISGSNVWAVGNYSESSPPTLTLIEHWNGSAWSIVTSPNVASAQNYLNSVSAVSAGNIWAAGYSASTSGAIRPLVENWDGSTWSKLPVMNPSNSNTAVYGVAARTTSDVWLVGDSINLSTGLQATFTEHWDGSSWTIIPSPSPGSHYNSLSSISAISANNARAVGYYVSATGDTTLVEHWNGTVWSVVTSPSGGDGSTLLGVSALTGSDVWAVGYYDISQGVSRTLVEHFNTCSGTPTPLPSPTTCALQFEDVPTTYTFYPYIECLACRSIINGYARGGTGEPCDPAHDPYFRPNANVTRGQIAKIVALSSGIDTSISGQTFQDVPPGSAFYTYTEQLYTLGVMNGYACGGSDPCVPPNNRPYFRPNANTTRGQLAKIDANTAGYTDAPTDQTFEDVAPGSTFYTYTQRLTGRGVMSGYPCGGTGEPCNPAHDPYFRPNADVTRGQTSKIVANTFETDCQVP